MDSFLPLFLSSVAILVVLWLCWNFNYAGGWPEIVTCLTVFFGFRDDLVRRQQQKERQQREEIFAWLNEEIDRIYEGGWDSR